MFYQSTYAVNLELNLATVRIGIVVAVQTHIGALALAHGRRPVQRLGGGRSDAIDATVQKTTRRGTLVRGHQMAVQSAEHKQQYVRLEVDTKQ